jgi:polygalacturonase
MGDGTIDGRGGEKILGKNVTWWDLAEQARNGGRQQVPRIIVTDTADNFTLYRITLKNSPNFHVVYNHGDGFTVWGLKIDTPKRGARNTDGVDPGAGSKNITITHSYIRTGDDNVAIKGGPGGVTSIGDTACQSVAKPTVA